MGGTIRVILREEDGKINNMFRWTNSFPAFLKSTKFINKDKEHLNNYMASYFEMKEDWEKNHESGNFEFNMTSVYFPTDDSISPCDYGILVIDYMTETVVSMQGYSCPFNIYGNELISIFDEKKRELNIKSNCTSKEELEDYQKMIDEGIIGSCLEFKDEIGKWVERKIEKHEIPLLIEKYKNNIFALKFVINISPWKTFHFQENKEDAIKAKEKIAELGFKYNEEDDRLWEEFIKVD